MDALFWILVGVTVLAAIGHGIWVVMAALFRGMAGLFAEPAEPPLRAEICPRCGTAWESRGDRRGCALCGWPAKDVALPSPVTTDKILSYLERRLERFCQLGLIRNEIRDRL